MDAFFEVHLVRRFAFARRQAPGVERVKRQALPVVFVVVRFARDRPAFGVAQLLEELLRVLAASAREAPSEALAAPDEDIRRDRGDGALGVDARTVQVGLEDELGIGVTELRTHDGERMAARGVTGADEQEVGGLVPRGFDRGRGTGGGRADRARFDDAGTGRRACGHGVVGEGLGGGGRRFRILRLLEIPEHLEAFDRPVFLLEAREELRIEDFVAAAVAKDRPDQRETRDRVGEIDRRQPQERR